MPEEIAPVFAPFPTIDFKKPQFPSETVTVSLSTSGINTAAIQQTIDELSARGGGTVRIPAGEWFTGRIILKDNINLNLEDGAALRFSGEIKDYQPAVFTRYEGVEVMSLGGCIYANNATNIAVTGKGRLIGPGKSSAVHKQVRSDTIDNYIDWDSPVSERVYDGVNSEHIFPPMFISPIKINCSKLFRAQDLVDSRFSDIEVTTDDSTISLLDAKNLLFENIDFRISGNISLDIEGPASENIEFRSCTNIDDGVYP
jgi:polygalacturonase